MPRRRPDGTHYPSTQPNRCRFCGDVGDGKRNVVVVDGVPAHKSCRPPRPCAIRGCVRPCKTRTLCTHHYNRRYYLADILGQRERSRQWALANPEKAAARNARRDKDAAAAASRKWYRANRLRALATAHNCRARSLGVPGTVTAEQLFGRLRVFGSRCYLCLGEANGFDHVKPLVAGGPHLASNLRPICTSCNSTKGSHWNGVGSWAAA